MRQFSILEKKIIEEIVKIGIEKPKVLNIVSEVILSNRVINIDQAKKSIDIWYFKEDKDAIIELFETVALINYLEKNDLIFIHWQSEYTLGNKNKVTKNVDKQFLDKNRDKMVSESINTNIYDYIMRYNLCFLHPSTTLIEFYKNKFKSDEEIKFEKEMKEMKTQTNLSRYSFLIAIAALLFTFVAPFLFETTIDKKQFEKIILKNGNQTVELKDIKTELKILKDSLSKRKAIQTQNTRIANSKAGS